MHIPLLDDLCHTFLRRTFSLEILNMSMHLDHEPKVALSSDRQTQSRAFRMAMSIVDLPVDRALFLGCGNGRNIRAVQADEHIGVDFSEAAVRQSRSNLESEDGVKIVRDDIENWLEKCQSTFDLFVDSYFSCHFQVNKFRNLQNQIKSVASENSLYFWSGIGIEDEFYNEVAEQLDYPFVRDINNEIIKRLYTIDELKDDIIEFEHVAVNSLYFNDLVNGEEYEREILWGLYRI